MAMPIGHFVACGGGALATTMISTKSGKSQMTPTSLCFFVSTQLIHDSHCLTRTIVDAP